MPFFFALAFAPSECWILAMLAKLAITMQCNCKCSYWTAGIISERNNWHNYVLKQNPSLWEHYSIEQEHTLHFVYVPLSQPALFQPWHNGSHPKLITTSWGTCSVKKIQYHYPPCTFHLLHAGIASTKVPQNPSVALMCLLYKDSVTSVDFAPSVSISDYRSRALIWILHHTPSLILECVCACVSVCGRDACTFSPSVSPVSHSCLLMNTGGMRSSNGITL